MYTAQVINVHGRGHPRVTVPVFMGYTTSQGDAFMVLPGQGGLTSMYAYICTSREHMRCLQLST